jgi:hypothetical protein
MDVVLTMSGTSDVMLTGVPSDKIDELDAVIRPLGRIMCWGERIVWCLTFDRVYHPWAYAKQLLEDANNYEALWIEDDGSISDETMHGACCNHAHENRRIADFLRSLEQ